MEHYKDAAVLWSIIIDNPNRVPFFSPNDRLTYGHEISNKLFQKYPKAYDRLEITRAGFGKEIYLNDFLSVIWSEASKELKKASSYL